MPGASDGLADGRPAELEQREPEEEVSRQERGGPALSAAAAPEEPADGAAEGHGRRPRKTVNRQDTATTETSSRPAVPITCEDLRHELRHLAEAVLEPQLRDSAARMQRDLRNEFQHFMEAVLEPRLRESAAQLQRDLTAERQQHDHLQPLPAEIAAVPPLDLRSELLHFAEAVLEPQLRDSVARLQRELLAELQPATGPEPSPTERAAETPLESTTDGRLTKESPPPSPSRSSKGRRQLLRTQTLEMAETEEILSQLDKASQGKVVAPKNVKAKVTPDDSSPRQTVTNSTFDTVLATASCRTRRISWATGSADLDLRPSRWRSCHRCVKRIVKSGRFEKATSAAILVNAIYIGVATEYIAVHELEEMPTTLTAIELFFLAIFTTETGLRFCVHKLDLFRPRFPNGSRNQLMCWNILDCLVIGLQVTELMFTLVNVEVRAFSGLSVVRLLRLVRLVRIIRVVKVLRWVRELRMIVYSIWRSLSLFIWAITALMLLNFMCSVYFTEYVLTKKLQGELTNPEDANRYFGTLTRTMLSLFMAVTGGIDWGDLSNTLAGGELNFVVVPFVFYVAFATFALLNVVSGIFLDTAMEIAKDEKEVFVVRNARSVFDKLDHNKDGTITWQDFRQALDHPHVQSFFDSLRIHISEAQALFDLLDMSGDGVVSADEFLNGCIRVRGPAKALDLLVLSREVSQLFEAHAAGQKEQMGKIEKKMSCCSSRRSSRPSIKIQPAEIRAEEERDGLFSMTACESPPRNLMGMFQLSSQATVTFHSETSDENQPRGQPPADASGSLPLGEAGLRSLALPPGGLRTEEEPPDMLS